MKDGLFNGILGGCDTAPAPVCNGIPHGELYNERKEQADYIELTKQFYEGQIATQKEIDNRFFGLYKLNGDNSFALDKNHVDDSFALYKGY